MDPKVFFTTEKLQPDQDENIKLLNLAAIDFAHAVLACVPPSADQKDCIRKLREIVYVGQEAIKLRGDP